MSEEQAPYHTSTSAAALARAAHACRERVLHVGGALSQLLSDVRAGELDDRAAVKRCERLSDELRKAAEELEGRSGD
jgi:hypothetical protein